MRATVRTLLCLSLLLVFNTAVNAAHIRARYQRSAKARVARRIVRWAPLLKGSHDSLLRQNEEIDRLQLTRIADEDELQELIDRQELVALPAGKYVRVDPRLDEDRRFCRPWTSDFLEDLGEAYYQEFRQPIQVNSAVRTVEQQAKLTRHNRNAAPSEGPTASSHLAGLTVDIAKHGMTRKQRKWLEKYLVRLRDLKLVEAAEERKQAVFHVMVSERYTAWRATQDKIASR